MSMGRSVKWIAGCLVAAMAGGGGFFLSEARADDANAGNGAVSRFQAFGLEVTAGPIRDVSFPGTTAAKVRTLCIETWTECTDVWAREIEGALWYRSPIDPFREHASVEQMAEGLISALGFNARGKHAHIAVLDLERPTVRIWLEGVAAPLTVQEYQPWGWRGDKLPFYTWPSVKAAAETYADQTP